MNGDLSYRIFTIAAGILVAVLVIVFVWTNSTGATVIAPQHIQVSNETSVLESIVRKAVDVTAFEVRF